MEIFTRDPAAYEKPRPKSKQTILPKIDSKPQYETQEESPNPVEKKYNTENLNDSPFKSSMGFSKVARALEDKRMDAYAKITHLNAQMNAEEQARRRKEGTSRKNL